MAKELSCYLVNTGNAARTECPAWTLEKPRDATRVDKTVEYMRRDETRAHQPVARNRLNI